MKQSTVSFSQTTIKIITSILTIMLLVGLTLLASTTIKADYTADYILIYNNSTVYVSNTPIYHYRYYTSKYIGVEGANSYVLEIVYNSDIQDWVTQSVLNLSLPSQKNYIRLGTSTYVAVKAITETNTTDTIATNSGWNETEQSNVGSYSSTINLPSGLSESRVNELINEQLNSTTSASSTAQSIQTQATTAYQNYSEGTITLAQLQGTIDSLASQLQDLNSLSSATLADKVAINNAITQTQLIQDGANKDAIIAEMEQDLTVSSSVSSTITGKINQANQVFNQYTQGSVTQSEAVTQINQYINQLTQLITPQTPTAAINAINAAINTINGIKDSITSYSDLDDSISESAQNSDKEELEYLENIEAETTDNIDSLKSKVDNTISESDANQVKNNVIAPILQNTLIVKLLPIAALFMVLAVTLGFKYRL